MKPSILLSETTRKRSGEIYWRISEKGEKSKTEFSCDGDCGDDCTCKEKARKSGSAESEARFHERGEFAASVHETGNTSGKI